MEEGDDGNDIFNKQFEYQDSFEPTEQITDNRFGDIVILQNIENKDQLIFAKEKVTKEQEDCEQDIVQAQERLKLTHSNLLTMIDYSVEVFQSEENEENLEFVVVGYYEYPDYDLSLEIEDRKQEMRYFTEDELLSLEISMLEVLNYLREFKMVHGDIRPKYIYFDSSGEFNHKLLDRLGDPSAPNQVQINNLKKKYDLYMSPALYSALTQRKSKIKHNPYKSDAFSLGLVILEAGLLSSVQPIYKEKEIDMETLLEFLEKFLEIYGENRILKESLLWLLDTDEKDRKDPRKVLRLIEDIQNEEYENQQGRGSDVNQSYSQKEIEMMDKSQNEENNMIDNQINNEAAVPAANQSKIEESPMIKNYEINENLVNQLQNKNQTDNIKNFDESNLSPVSDSPDIRNMKRVEEQLSKKNQKREEPISNNNVNEDIQIISPIQIKPTPHYQRNEIQKQVEKDYDEIISKPKTDFIKTNTPILTTITNEQEINQKPIEEKPKTNIQVSIVPRRLENIVYNSPIPTFEENDYLLKKDENSSINDKSEMSDILLRGDSNNVTVNKIKQESVYGLFNVPVKTNDSTFGNISRPIKIESISKPSVNDSLTNNLQNQVVEVKSSFSKSRENEAISNNVKSVTSDPVVRYRRMELPETLTNNSTNTNEYNKKVTNTEIQQQTINESFKSQKEVAAPVSSNRVYTNEYSKRIAEAEAPQQILKESFKSQKEVTAPVSTKNIIYANEYSNTNAIQTVVPQQIVTGSYRYQNEVIAPITSNNYKVNTSDYSKKVVETIVPQQIAKESYKSQQEEASSMSYKNINLYENNRTANFNRENMSDYITRQEINSVIPTSEKVFNNSITNSLKSSYQGKTKKVIRIKLDGTVEHSFNHSNDAPRETQITRKVPLLSEIQSPLRKTEYSIIKENPLYAPSNQNYADQSSFSKTQSMSIRVQKPSVNESFESQSIKTLPFTIETQSPLRVHDNSIIKDNSRFVENIQHYNDKSSFSKSQSVAIMSQKPVVPETQLAELPFKQIETQISNNSKNENYTTEKYNFSIKPQESTPQYFVSNKELLPRTKNETRYVISNNTYYETNNNVNANPTNTNNKMLKKETLMGLDEILLSNHYSSDKSIKLNEDKNNLKNQPIVVNVTSSYPLERTYKPIPVTSNYSVTQKIANTQYKTPEVSVQKSINEHQQYYSREKVSISSTNNFVNTPYSTHTPINRGYTQQNNFKPSFGGNENVSISSNSSNTQIVTRNVTNNQMCTNNQMEPAQYSRKTFSSFVNAPIPSYSPNLFKK